MRGWTTRAGRTCGRSSKTHLRFCHSLRPLCHAYPLEAERLAGLDVTFFSVREAGVVLGRVSLETGTMREFALARRLYERAGFLPCGPFGDYKPSPHNTFMTLSLVATR